MEQILCFYQKIQEKIHASNHSNPLGKLMAVAIKSEFIHINQMNRKGIVDDIRDQVTILQQVESLTRNTTVQAPFAAMAAIFLQLQMKIQSCTGNFRDIFNTYGSIRGYLKQHLGDLCGQYGGTELTSGNLILLFPPSFHFECRNGFFFTCFNNKSKFK